MENIVTRLDIKGELTIFTAADLRQRLLDALDSEAEIEVNLSEVGEIDSAGLQLMIAAKLEAALRGKRLHFRGHSAHVIDVLELCNFSGHLGDPMSAGSQS